MPLVLKKIRDEVVRELKAEAARRGLTVSEAVEEAVRLWLQLSKGIIVEDSFVDDLVWERAREELLARYRGKYVVIFDGRVQGVFENLEEVSRFLRERKPRRAVVVRPGVDGEEGVVGEWLGGSLEPA